MYRPYGKDPHRWQEFFVDFEKVMNQLDGRPHWAKIHSWTYNECKKSWPMFEKFVQLRDRLDPNRLFWNDYMQRIFSTTNDSNLPTPQSEH
jgi:FAD/FMN-containing dehydrogenase